ncbi:MAG: rod shape-determining protein MreD [Gammaproteobacteria bacterium]|nr:rod shape-determining protein MreD [Gammaproteobacteria bacterium]
MIKATHSWWAIPVTFLVAFILTLLPMPEWTVWFRPAWLLMALIYWSMKLPYRVNVGTAWMIGLALDVLNGTLLGEHALALTITIYFVIRMHTRLRMYPLMQQSLWVCMLVMFYQFILYCIQGFIGSPPKTGLYWAPALTSMLLWPWVFIIMQNHRRRFKVA